MNKMLPIQIPKPLGNQQPSQNRSHSPEQRQSQQHPRQLQPQLVAGHLQTAMTVTVTAAAVAAPVGAGALIPAVLSFLPVIWTSACFIAIAGPLCHPLLHRLLPVVWMSACFIAIAGPCTIGKGFPVFHRLLPVVWMSACVIADAGPRTIGPRHLVPLWLRQALAQDYPRPSYHEGFASAIYFAPLGGLRIGGRCGQGQDFVKYSLSYSL